ncbi:MAG: rhodanese-like domain-containing protein [Eudoraea sp.]|nr:rhodanese-like domain-containing protein [Eudoraea sp.]
MADLSQQEWTEKLNADDQAFILDVRTPEEFEAGYIPEAININIYEGQDFLDAVDKLDKSKNYYVYCRSGNRSRQACALMNNMGFGQAYNLEGGIMEWQGKVIH